MLLWIGVFTLFPLTIATTKIMEGLREDPDFNLWLPLITEFSSAFVVLLLVPCILFIDQRIPIATDNWPKRLLLHLPLSIAFSVIHISGMVSIRIWTFQMLGETYSYDEPLWLFVYEYRKDLVVYISIMIALYAYREIIRLRMGEAQLAAEEDAENDDRILVSKRGMFHFIDPGTIQWVEAAGNYVELHVGAETYMLRSTMKEIEKRLGSDEFARIHRSTIIRKNLITGINPALNGDKIVTLEGGEDFRFSRRYRQNLEPLP